MTPRLTQPLFGEAYQQLQVSPELYHFMRAYDCIWSLVNQPSDVGPQAIVQNALANLHVLGSVISELCGDEIFDADPKQLVFDLET